MTLLAAIALQSANLTMTVKVVILALWDKIVTFTADIKIMSIFKKHSIFFVLVFSQVHAQQIYRCPSIGEGVPEYINSGKLQERLGKGENCKLVSGGNVIVVKPPTTKEIEDMRKKAKEAESKRYRDAVRAKAKFLDDVDEERAKNKKL